MTQLFAIDTSTPAGATAAAMLSAVKDNSVKAYTLEQIDEFEDLMLSISMLDVDKLDIVGPEEKEEFLAALKRLGGK